MLIDKVRLNACYVLRRALRLFSCLLIFTNESKGRHLQRSLVNLGKLFHIDTSNGAFEK